MSLIGRLHPLLIHFPIALVIAAAAAETAALLTVDDRWRTVSVVNVRAGALCGLAAVIAGWRLAAGPAIEPSAALEWHRWVGVAGAAAVSAAAVAPNGINSSASSRGIYRAALFAGAALIAVAGHLGGQLVWGADFLRP